MKNIKLLIFAFCILTFNSCVQEELIEENLPVTVVEIDGNDYFIKGTLDGEPFEMRHYSLDEINQFTNTTLNGPGQSYFNSQFFKRDATGSGNTTIKMSITENSENTLPEVLSIGEIPWYPRDNDVIFQNGQIIWNPSIGEVCFPIININGKNYADAMDFEYNKFEITNFSLLDNSNEFTGSSWEGKVYKVEGNFQIKLVAPSGDQVNLVIDDFSALFLNK